MAALVSGILYGFTFDIVAIFIDLSGWKELPPRAAVLEVLSCFAAQREISCLFCFFVGFLLEIGFCPGQTSHHRDNICESMKICLRYNYCRAGRTQSSHITLQVSHIICGPDGSKRPVTLTPAGSSPGDVFKGQFRLQQLDGGRRWEFMGLLGFVVFPSRWPKTLKNMKENVERRDSRFHF